MIAAQSRSPWRFKAPGRLSLRCAILLAPLVLAACEPGQLQPEGSIASAEKTILIDSMLIMLAIVIPTIAAILGAAWWFRASNPRARYTPGWGHSGQIELVIWGIPALTVMLLGGVTWVASHDLDPAKPLVSKAKPLDVQVVSLDWKWLFIYPEQHVASVNKLVIPAATPVHFTLTSASVMNTFWIPQLGSMIYTMNGMQVQLNLDAERPGTFASRSGHYSGDGFSDMYFDTQAVTEAGFTDWVASTRAAAGPTLDAASYAQLSKQSSKVTPFTYHDADPAMFTKIVSQQIPPAPGPQAGLPSVDVSNRTE